jgi:Autotransporter beta-domain/Bacterial Ig-like domain (group 3)
VTFKDGSTMLGSITLTSINGSISTTASFQTLALAAGSHTITVSYGGDLVFDPSSGATTQVVQAATTSPSATRTPADSQNLSTVQTQGSATEANESGTAITSAVADAANTQMMGLQGLPPLTFPNLASPNYADEQPSSAARRANEAFAQLGDGVLVTKAPGKVQYLSGLWSVWADLTGSGFNQSSGGGLNGNQVNATAGIGYKLKPDVVVGVFGGFENFNYDFAALEGRFKGDGGTIGTYAGWAITPTLRWNAMLGWTGLSYDDSAGNGAGSFAGSRWLFSTGLTGSYRVREFVLEPSATVFALSEHQSSYTDSLGAAHDALDFSSGRASLGGRVLLPTQVQSFAVTPYVGFYSDWYFASDNAVAADVPSGFGNSWSARAAAGLSMPVLKDGTLSLGGDYGGIGANYKIWTGTARVNLPF